MINPRFRIQDSKLKIAKEFKPKNYIIKRGRISCPFMYIDI